MQVEFRGASAKKHQYTVALYVDDMRLEKKNKSINEPIYFYASGSKQPLELVVNSVSDKKISGYLSVPKAAATSAKVNTQTNPFRGSQCRVQTEGPFGALCFFAIVQSHPRNYRGNFKRCRSELSGNMRRPKRTASAAARGSPSALST